MRERDLDQWWEALPQKRKAQIHSWLSKDEEPGELPNQIALFQKGQEQEGEAL